MRLALKTREVVVPPLTGKTVNEATALLAEAGLKLKVEEGRRVDPKVPAGQIVCAGAAGRRPDAARAQRQGLGQRRAALDDRAGAARRVGADRRSCGCSRTASSWRRPPRSGRRTTRRRRSSRRRRRRRAARAQVALLVNRGERGATLRDARSDRRQRRSRRRPAARRAASASRSSAIIRIPACRPASCCGRIRRPVSRSRRASRSRSRSAG